jgi:hypothetical protein
VRLFTTINVVILLTTSARFMIFEALCCLVLVDNQLIIAAVMMANSVLQIWSKQLFRYGHGPVIKGRNATSRLSEALRNQAESEKLLDSQGEESQPDIGKPPIGLRNWTFMALGFFVLLSVLSLTALSWSLRDSYSALLTSITWQPSNGC